MKIIFVLSSTTAGSREFVRRAAHTPQISVTLVRGDAGAADVLPLLASADRIWFEGAGPLLLELLRRPNTGYLSGVVLRVDETDLGRLPLADCWRLVKDLIVPTRAAAREVAAVAPPPVGVGRIHILRPDVPGGAAENVRHDVDRYAEILLSPPGDLPLAQWQRIVDAGDACRGDCLIVGDAPDHFHQYLTESLGCCTLAGDPRSPGAAGTATPDGLLDTVVFWESLGHAMARQALPGAMALLRPGGSVVVVCPTGQGGGACSPSAAAGLLRDAGGSRLPEVYVCGDVAVASVPAPPGATAPAPPVGRDDLPLVTAIIPAYNAARTMDRAVLSLRRQTYPNLEILVVDDGSDDDTSGVVARHLDDPRVRYIYKPHSGVCDTRNVGLAEAQGEYVAWMGADDESLPNRISRQVTAALQPPAADVVWSDGLFMEVGAGGMSGGAARPRLKEVRRYAAFTDAEAPAMCLRGCPILDTAAMVRKTLYDRLGGYDPSFPRGQDYEFFTRAAIAGGVTYRHVPVPLVRVYQLPLDRPELLPVRLETYARLSDRLISGVGLDRLLDARSRDLGEPPALAVARVLIQKARMRGARPGHRLLLAARKYLEEVVETGRPSDRSAALSLLIPLAREAGDVQAAVAYYEQARRPAAPQRAPVPGGTAIRTA